MGDVAKAFQIIKEKQACFVSRGDQYPDVDCGPFPHDAPIAFAEHIGSTIRKSNDF